jgi:hypothetical protein
MRASVLDKQTAIKRTEQMLIEKAYNAINPPTSLFQTVPVAVKKTETNSDGNLSAKKMAYLDSVGLCFTNAKGEVLKKVNTMDGLEYLIHQINDYFAMFFEDTILPDHGVGIFTRLKLQSETLEEELDTGGEDTVLYRGDPFWSSSHGSNLDKESSDAQEKIPQN